MYIAVLASEENLSKYYEMADNSDDVTIQEYNILVYRTFTDFIMRTKTIYNFEALVIDISDCDFKNDDINRGIEIHKQFCNTRLVFVIDGARAEELGTVFSDNEIYNVMSSDSKNFAKDFKDCLSPDGKNLISSIALKANVSIEQVRKRIKPCLGIPTNKKIVIGIIGAMSRAGSTTLAVNIVSYLKYMEIPAAYVDPTQKHIEQFLSVYSDSLEEKENYLLINNIPLLSDIMADTSQFNIYVVDCGKDLELFKECDIRLLCSGSKLWELPYMVKAINEVENVKLLFNFTSNEDRESIESIWSENIYFMPYSPDLWHCENIAHYNDFLVPILKEFCGDNK